MERVELGRTGREVARIGFGAMHLSLEGRPEWEAAKRVIHRAVELGVTLIDTADAYCIDENDKHHNERLIREALAEIDAMDRVVVATKGGVVRPAGRWERDGRPEHLRAACEASLSALGVESIELYQFHAPDPEVPFTESVGEFARLHAEGKVRAVGLSNVSLDQLREAREIVEIASVQNRFNPWDRAAEHDGLLRYCDENAITFIPFSPLGGKRKVGQLSRSTELQELADRLGATAQEAVLAWLLTRSGSLVPIPGSSRTETLESSVRAGEIRLDAATVTELERTFRGLPE